MSVVHERACVVSAMGFFGSLLFSISAVVAQDQSILKGVDAAPVLDALAVAGRANFEKSHYISRRV